jgi:phospholipid transport system substrate-binding protein
MDNSLREGVRPGIVGPKSNSRLALRGDLSPIAAVQAQAYGSAMPAHPARQYVALILVATLALMQGPGVYVSAAGADETAQSALDLVRSSVARVHGAGHSPGSRGPESERVEIRRAAVTLFDVEAMSRRMLTRYWNDGSAQQQAEFIRLLSDLLERALGDVIVSTSGATIFDGESVEGGYAQVRSHVVADRGPDISIEYRLSRSGERWVVYDILHDGASLVSDYRAQFSSILRTSSLPSSSSGCGTTRHRRGSPWTTVRMS